jgi:DNA (cytosine-5)-methyltransferase 1
MLGQDSHWPSPFMGQLMKKKTPGRGHIDVQQFAGTLIVVDLFCGGGGTSQALKEACEEMGINFKLYALNHWDTAIDTHEENHPEAIHGCGSVGDVDPLAFVPEGYCDILLASPECIFFSSARGGKPINDQRRSTAWEVVDRWVPALKPKQILIENVQEFENWCDVYPDDYPVKKKRGRPIPELKGTTFQQYIGELKGAYNVEYRKQIAADFGAATSRKRLFIMASRKDLKEDIIAWPEPTHSKTGANGLKKWRAAREIIDWSMKGESIFDRKRPLAPATMRRILVGLERHGGDALKPYLVALRNHMDGKPIDGPVPTIAAGGTTIGLAEPYIFHTTHSGRFTDVDKPLPTVTAAQRGEMGIVESAFLLSQQSGGVARPVNEPAMTVAAKGAIGLVEFMLPPRHMNDGQIDSLEDPIRTITAAAGHCYGKTDACLVPFYNERPGQAPRSHSLDDPAPTIPATGDGKFGLVDGVLVSVAHGDNPEGSGRGNGGRDRSVDAPAPSVTASGSDYGLVEPVLVEYHSETSGGENRTRSLDEALPTQTTENRFGVAEPILINLSHGQRVHDMDKPVPVITTAKGGELAVAEPIITSYYGTVNVSPVSAPLRTATAKSRFGLAMPVINGMTLDIRFRMLQPHELAMAMDFPPGYKFVGVKKKRAVRARKTKNGFHKTDTVNKGEGVRMIGNAVDVAHGKALIKTRINVLIEWLGRQQEAAA